MRVSHYHWMTGAQFLNAVALGQVTPGQVTPGQVVQIVTVVGVRLLGADRFDQIRGDRRARGFLDGAGPAAIGAILGSAIPLTRALTRPCQ